MTLSISILASLIAFQPAAQAAKAACFKADTIKIWEEKYGFSTTGADDLDSEVFQSCFRKVKADKAIPKKKCARIEWLKDKACKDDPASGNTRESCLSNKTYLKKIEKTAPYIGS